MRITSHWFSWGVACAAVCVASGSTQAANRCVDTKGKVLPLAACQTGATSTAVATKGTYTTLPQRSASRGPQGNVYESNPDPDRGMLATTRGLAPGKAPAADARDGSYPLGLPIVIQLNGANGASASPAAAAPAATVKSNANATRHPMAR